jgi:hypothetical protein
MYAFPARSRTARLSRRAPPVCHTMRSVLALMGQDAGSFRGVVLGNPKLDDMRQRAVASTKTEADRFAKNVAPIIREIQESGVASHRGIPRALNARGVATARGGAWTTVQVGSILRRTAP